MKCKVCGFETPSKIRFCPQCQSYFVDANSPDSGIMWKGVVDENGVPSKQPKVPRRLNARLVWAIIALITSIINLIFTLLLVFVTDDYLLPGFSMFILSSIAFFLSKSNKLSWIALGLLIIALVIFVNS